jgi:phage recombination protein Bet
MTSQAIERSQPQRKEMTIEMVVEMTGLGLPKLALIRHTMASGLGCTPDQVPLVDLAMFVEACNALGLNPLVRQAYWIKRNGRGALQVAIDGFRAVADGAGNYAGSSEPVFRGRIEWRHRGKVLLVPEYAQVTVWKIVQGHKAAFTGEARWMEYVPKVDGAAAESDMWAKMPFNQLAKCAEAQGLRKGWALQLGKVELTAFEPSEEELPEVAAPAQRVTEQRTPEQNAAQHQAIFDANYADDVADQRAPEPEVAA